MGNNPSRNSFAAKLEDRFKKLAQIPEDTPTLIYRFNLAFKNKLDIGAYGTFNNNYFETKGNIIQDLNLKEGTDYEIDKSELQFIGEDFFSYSSECELKHNINADVGAFGVNICLGINYQLGKKENFTLHVFDAEQCGIHFKADAIIKISERLLAKSADFGKLFLIEGFTKGSQGAVFRNSEISDSAGSTAEIKFNPPVKFPFEGGFSSTLILSGTKGVSYKFVSNKESSIVYLLRLIRLNSYGDDEKKICKILHLILKL